MRAVVRCLLALSVAAATVVARPPIGVGLTAANQSYDFAVASIRPSPHEVVGVAHPLVLTFSAPVANRPAAERALTVRSVPPMTGKFEWLDNDVVQWVPDRFWPAHSTVELSVGPLSTEIKTGRSVLGIADISDHTFTVSIDGVGPPRPAPHHLPHAGQEGVMLASMGRPQFATPVGLYTVLSKDRTVVMDSSSVGIPVTDPQGYRIPVDYAVRISSRGLFVHSAPWAINALGFENVSHGCISLSPADAEWYYNNANIGDPVIVKE
jgi:lipoprotein-anchoring transpeptidase ErfK/SrfK